MKKSTLATAGLAGLVGLTSLVPMASAQAAPVAPSVSASASKLCPLSVAHRGGEGDVTDAKENSMWAFRRAANMGVGVMETDVWFTKDRIPVIMHDEDLDRTTDGTGLVGDYTWKYLRKNVRLNNGERIPSLKQSLKFFAKRQMPSFIEYKDADDPKLYAIYLDYLKEYGYKAWGAGFSKELLEWLHAEDPQLPLMWFGNKDTTLPAPGDVPAGANPGIINFRLDDAAVHAFRDAGLDVNVWFNTITKGDNRTGEPNFPGFGWEGMTRRGVTWISTDYPDKYKEWTLETGECKSRGPKRSKAFCVNPPKNMVVGNKYNILPRNCMTTADKMVKVKVTAKSSVARVETGKKYIKLRVRGPGKIQLRYTAKDRVFTSADGVSWKSYTDFKKDKRYRVRAANG